MGQHLSRQNSESEQEAKHAGQKRNAENPLESNDNLKEPRVEQDDPGKPANPTERRERSSSKQQRKPPTARNQERSAGAEIC
jgi:hypothetical protein